MESDKRTFEEIYQELDKVAQAFVELDNISGSLTEADHSYLIDRLIKKNAELVQEVVDTCDRRNFDQCSNRYDHCRKCKNGSNYKQRDYRSHKRWNEFNVFGPVFKE